MQPLFSGQVAAGKSRSEELLRCRSRATGCKDYMACFGVFLVSCEVYVRGQFCLENAFARAQSLKFSSARDEAALAKNLSLRGDRARKDPIFFAAPGTAAQKLVIAKKNVICIGGLLRSCLEA